MELSPAFIQLIAILYSILVAAVITAPTAIWIKLTGVTKEQGVLQEQISGMRRQIDEMNKLIDQTNKRIDQTNERIDQTNERIDRLRDDLREEMRRNTDRIILALVNHSHQDGSPPVFSVPPEIEPVAADD